MSDPDSIEAVTRAVLTLALDAASLRQHTIAANVAQHEATGYLRQQVDFEAQLADARAALAASGRLPAASLAGVRPHIATAAPLADGTVAPVRLDVEMADMAHNAVHYQALAQGLSREMGLLALAVADGRR